MTLNILTSHKKEQLGRTANLIRGQKLKDQYCAMAVYWWQMMSRKQPHQLQVPSSTQGRATIIKFSCSYYVLLTIELVIMHTPQMSSTSEVNYMDFEARARAV